MRFEKGEKSMSGTNPFRKLSLLFCVIAMIIVSGCSLEGAGPTGQTSNDPAAVQQYFPTIPGYSASQVNDIVEAITLVTGGASLATGNLLGSFAISRLQTMAECYQGVGAMDARVYTQLNIQQPVIGALAIVNQDRITENFLNCAIGGTGQTPRLTEPQPCIGSGTFTQNNDTYHYIYAASDQALCAEFTRHFSQFGR
jgi:hypothetical protein